jgi:deoxyinosine 3'endonuclease (endonuclease V)
MKKTLRKNLRKIILEIMDLKGLSGTLYGKALRTSGTINPIYISIGHKVSLETAVEIIKNIIEYLNLSDYLILNLSCIYKINSIKTN